MHRQKKSFFQIIEGISAMQKNTRKSLKKVA